MSQPSRPRAQRRTRNIKLEALTPLEKREVLAPVVSVYPTVATFTAAETPTNSFLGTVVVDLDTTQTDLSTAAPITSVAEMTPLASFGGDMVRIQAGPGGVFGNGLYAVSRGAGGNANAIDRPGVIYRVDPATGKATPFFDLNTVMNQLSVNPLSVDGRNPAAASLGGASGGATDATGFTNWYDIAFDAEGYIDGKPSMLVSTADRSDPSKNAIYRIAPDGSFLGAYVTMTDGQAATKFNINPTAVAVPGPEMQQYLKGVFSGGGVSTTGGTLAALFFNTNEYSPGQVISNSSTLPKGASQSGMYLGPIAGITPANIDYASPAYSVFTDFGTPGLPYNPDAGGIPAAPGVSGVQGSNGGLLITGPTFEDGDPDTFAPDDFPLVTTPFRRFEDTAFDQYGYFSLNVPLTASDAATTGGLGTFEVAGDPTYAGNLFVSDLATGLYVQVTSIEDLAAGIPADVVINVPVQGSGSIGIRLTDPSQPYNAVTNPLVPIVNNGNTTGGSNPLGGRVVRITPTGTLTTFAQGFNTSGAQNSTSFMDSTLSITFSADGTTFYASDDDAIWQFKTTASLAGSTSGTIIGLNDLRTLGVPYDGNGSAVAVLDTGVDTLSSPFRGRVGEGKNLYTGGKGNFDFAAFTGTGTGTGTGGGTGGNTGGGTGGTTGGNTVLANSLNGHGTPVAGVVAQFVPQATLEPVAIFSPYSTGGSLTSSGTGGGTGGNTGGGGTTTINAVSNTLTSTNAVYNGLAYVTAHPYVNDPVRPGKVSRVIASTMAFGTGQTWQSEAQAFKNYPQIVIALKLQLKKFRSLGIAPIAAAGQFGSPLGLGSGGSGTTGGGTTGGTTGTTGNTGLVRSNADNASAGDSNGMSLPAILNEVISVTGTYPFPYFADASTAPVNTAVGAIPNPLGPVLLFKNQLTIGGTASTGTGGTTGGGTTTGGEVDPNVESLAAGDYNIWSDRIPASLNRGMTTDFAAPAFDVPTFARRPDATALIDAGEAANMRLTFSQVGTSMSTGVLTGAYAMVSSALGYWSNIDRAGGLTNDAYLTTPVGVGTLNFGEHGVGDLSAFNTPDGINGILAWTAVPVFDVNDGGSIATPALVSSTDKQNGFVGADNPPAYARVSVSNAIAAIEGTQALNYLISNNVLPIIDANNDGLITAQEVQSFVDTANTKGMPEAGAMARLLGGTATTSRPELGVNNTSFYENPDQPGALQRRFNFFDYAANGELKGAVAIDSLKMLTGTLLPKPDDYVVVDRQRASANGFLLDPDAQRNTTALQHKLPRFMWVPGSTVARFRGMNPARFKINRNEAPGSYLPSYTLFDGTPGTTVQRESSKIVTTRTVNGKSLSVARVVPGAIATSTNKPVVTTPATTTPTNLVGDNQPKTTVGTATPTDAAAANAPTTSVSTTTAATPTTTSPAAVSTEAPTTPTTPTDVKSAERAAAELAAQQQAAQQQAAAQASAIKYTTYKQMKEDQSKNVFSKIWDEVKKPFS
jgi:hypothetical protein